MKQLLLVWWSAFLVLSSFGQLPPPFSNFSPDLVPSGILLDMDNTIGSDLPTGNSYDPVSFPHQHQFLHRLHRSSIDDPVVPSPESLSTANRVIQSVSPCIPIRLIFHSYEDFNENAVLNGWLIEENGEYIDQTNGQSSPFSAKRTFIPFCEQLDYWEGDWILTMPEDGIITNIQTQLTQIEIDPDDGFGWRSFVPGESIEVQFNSDNIDRKVRLRGLADGQLFSTAFTLKSTNSGGSTSPNLPPWETAQTNYPWRISTTSNGSEIKGNAYTLLSEDQVFDKPFLFVEGIDFGLNLHPLRNGTFGWPEFISGSSPDYPFLYNVPVLVDELRAAGYDVVLLDFEDGGADQKQNAQLLKHLIQLVNDHKEGEEELVIAGASMGGVISRIALREMELENTPHCTRTWISLDAPHGGANIPLSLQHSVEFLKHHFAEAHYFFFTQLDRTASRQLLLRQTSNGMAQRDAFAAYLDEIGFPEEVRKVGIADGSRDGVGLGFLPGTPILDYECEYLGQLAIKFLFTAYPGNPFHPLSTPFSSHIQHTAIAETESCSGVLDCVLNPPFFLETWESHSWTNSAIDNLDACPGGVRNTILTLIESINDNLANSLDVWPTPNCETAITNFIPIHSFIPTVSALGVASNVFDLSFEDFLETNPNSCPFDRYYAPEGENLIHSEIDQTMLELVLEEVFLGENVLPSELTNALNGGTYNMALPQQKTLYNLDIHSGGALFLNAFIPIGFGEEPLALPEFGSHRTIKTSGCGSEIHIGDDGFLQVGDVNGYSRSDFVIRSGSKVFLHLGGSLDLQQGSRIVIQAGAELHLDGGELYVNGDSQILIEEGAGFFIHSETPIQLEGVEARIDTHGKWIIDNGVSCTVECIGEEGGKLRFFSHVINIIGGPESELSVSGTSSSDKIIEIADGGALWTSLEFGKVELSNGQITIGDQAKLTTTGMLRMSECHVLGLGDPIGLRSYARVQMHHCALEALPAYFHPGSNHFRLENCSVSESAIRVESGGYRLTDSEFTDSYIESDGLFFNGHIERCSFLNSSDHFSAVYDESNSTLYVKESFFSDADNGITKNGGELRLRCNHLEYCENAISTGLYTTLNLSSQLGAGYNTFENNGVHLWCEGTESIELVNGYNHFATPEDYVIEGSVLGLCNEGCQGFISAAKNTWPSPNGPNASHFNLQIADLECNSATPNIPLDGCSAKVIDKHPTYPVSCGHFDPSGEKPMVALRKATIYANPSISTPTYNDVFLDDAILDAIWTLEEYHDEGNDALAIGKFHEILTFNYEEDNSALRGKLRNTEHIMRSAVLDLIESNEIDMTDWPAYFPPLLNENIAVLNHLTSAPVNVNNYRQQLSLEMSKAQLFMATERFSNSRNIIDHADNCGVAFNEQVALNRSHQSIYREGVFSTVFALYYDTDSLFNLEENLVLPEPSNLLVSNPVFGGWVLSPTNIEFPECDPFIPKSMEANKTAVRVYPNPAREMLHVEMPEGTEDFDLTIRDIRGHLLYERRMSNKLQTVQIPVADLATGMYVLELLRDGDRVFYEVFNRH